MQKEAWMGSESAWESGQNDSTPPQLIRVQVVIYHFLAAEAWDAQLLTSMQPASAGLATA